jgi:hypothetical protein
VGSEEVEAPAGTGHLSLRGTKGRNLSCSAIPVTDLRDERMRRERGKSDSEDAFPIENVGHGTFLSHPLRMVAGNHPKRNQDGLPMRRAG